MLSISSYLLTLLLDKLYFSCDFYVISSKAAFISESLSVYIPNRDVLVHIYSTIFSVSNLNIFISNLFSIFQISHVKP